MKYLLLYYLLKVPFFDLPAEVNLSEISWTVEDDCSFVLFNDNAKKSSELFLTKIY